MSTKTKPLSLDEQRSRLERRANVIRSRLLRTIDALDTRRHQVQEIGHHAKRMAVPLLASVLGAAVIAAGTVIAIKSLVERRRERDFSYRVAKAIQPFRAEVKPPFWSELLRKLALTALTMVATEAAKRGSKALFDGRTLAFLPAHVGEPDRALSTNAPRLLGK